MSSSAPKKPLSKLQRRIQAGLAGAASGSVPISAQASTGESRAMEVEEPTNAVAGRADPLPLLARDFPFGPAPPSLCGSPSNLAAALPRPERRANTNRLIFSLPQEIFLQPCLPNAFLDPSPDDQVLLARQGTSLGPATRRS
ncbi:hypothetical protein VP01_1318g6 [Puccinia sorghi]|uniref:Uncharacterized protein n=1 Tax=Puccinia sorghi TaxID=27349 RepID=A0A0L6VMP9_9BASI|nr:hypothetical protein VP01_1318g6 [Puccinia sorghi]